MRKLFYILSLVLLLCTPIGAIAQNDIFFIDWKRMPLDSVIPRYTEVIPLESDYSKYNYDVRLLYPEWKEMTKLETAKMNRWVDQVSTDLVLNSFVGVSRGKGMLDVDFVPVVKRDGKLYKLMSAKMEIEALPKSQSATADISSVMGVRKAAMKTAAASERYAANSKLSQGRWVKISVREDGMYRLTRSALLKMGFKNPQNVHLYGYGGYRLSEESNPANEYDDLQEVPLYQVNSDTWLFWGNGLVYWDGNTRVFNQYARGSCYFLTEEETPGKIETIDGTATMSGAPITTFADHVLYEKDEFAYAQFGRNLFENANFSGSGARTYKLTTPTESTSNERLSIVFTAAAKSPTTLSPQVNGNTLTNMTVPAIGSYQYGASVSKLLDVSSYKKGAEWTIKLASTSGNDAHLDYLALHFIRPISPGQTFVAFSSTRTGAGMFQVSDCNEWCKVMQIGEPGSPARLIEGKLDAGKFTFSTENLSRRYVCFNIYAKYPEPQVVGEVDNQNLHGLSAADMVIIIPESGKLQYQAERLAETHRAVDGLRVHVVRADQVYNEFSSGTPDATAYRRLMKMFYDRAEGRDEDMPRYLLLMGDCSFDNRMISSAWSRVNPKDYLLCFESENSFSDTQSYVMEDYFGLLDDGEGKNLTREKIDLGVGRFPVTSADEAKIMVDKVVDFISNSNAGAWKNVVMMLGDDGDNNSHMEYCDDVANSIIENYPELEVKKVMWDAYTRVSTLSSNTYPEVTNTIKKQLEDGVMMMNYTGHGGAYLLSHEGVWHTEDYENFKSMQLPLWFTAACDIMPFDGQTVNQGEQAVLTKEGGALAFIGTTRTVYATNNMHLNRLFSKYVFGNDSKGRRLRLGDALRQAKVDLVGSETMHLENKLQYALLGDPALVIGAPLNRVRLDAIIDNSTGKETDVLRAGMNVKLVGHIEDAEKNPISQFRGVLTARIYDSMDTITCKRNGSEVSDAFVFHDRSSVIYEGRDSVRNGQFSLTFVVPKDIKYSNYSGRIVMYAINESRNVEANGFSEDFTVGGSVETSDNVGPEIEMSLNGEFGGVVNASPFLSARLSDVNGINSSGKGVGHDILLSVDNDPNMTYVLNDYFMSDFGDFTKGSLAYVIPVLPAGPHTLYLRAWDLLNNTSLSEMDFIVDPSYEPSIISLTASPNPAKTSTTFILSKNLSGSECNFLIEVFDYAGRRMWMQEGSGISPSGTFYIPWDLSIGNGNGRIGPGIYIYRATITEGQSKRVTKSQKLIVN